MAPSNYERVTRVMDLLRRGLTPFVAQEMEAALGANWATQAAQRLRRDGDSMDEDGGHMDVHALLVIMWNHWNEVFARTLGHAERSLVSELRDVRNRWAHQHAFSADDTHRVLDSAARLLTAISAPEAREIEAQKQDVMRILIEAQNRRESRRAAALAVDGRPQAGLRPWREVITAHPDVMSEGFSRAEFAADLANVIDVDAHNRASEYADPTEFYQRTYLTEGLRYLLSAALRRLSGAGGEPVVELQTNFGGGKTHSMLALYHLFSGARPADLPGSEVVFQEVGVDEPPTARRAVMVGTALQPGQAHTKPDGTRIHTLWGELAWQLGAAAGDGAEGYALVAEADRNGTSPGSDTLCDLFTRYSPCLVLIDEWVAYVRQTYGKQNLPGGSFDANLTFAQALTEAARRAPATLLVASLPASDVEVGGEGGREALARLRNTFGRLQSPWRPATTEEGFEIVRRRLFQPLADAESYAARDAVVSAFSALYRQQSSEFPPNCKEADYERRMRAAYPLHPELFDRLYGDWSTLDRFQRTRGVLRLMATVIRTLWERGDGALLIMPAGIPIDADAVQSEFRMYLEDNWAPVIEKDVDGPNSLPLALDREIPNLGRYSASRRVARTVYMGSAPTASGKNPGLEESRIKLGCVQPGETVATFGDALRRLTGKATHLYVDRSRYWFSLQPSVTRLAQDRAAQLESQPDVVHAELRTRLQADTQADATKRGNLGGVHVMPASNSDVPDEQDVRMVVLGPEYVHAAREATSPARAECAAILSQRGASPRLHQNMLVFLAPDRARLTDLEDAIRGYLAWRSICDDRESLNLDVFQSRQATTKCEDADKTVASRLGETYIWLLVPDQPDPRSPGLEWEESRLAGNDALAVRASRKLRNEEQLITEFSSTRLRMELDRLNLWGEGDHLNLRTLWGYFSRYLYLPRLLNANVLISAVQQGFSQITWHENYAYAEGWDETARRYRNLRAGQVGSVVMDGHSLIVKPEAARRQVEQDEPAVTPPPPLPTDTPTRRTGENEPGTRGGGDVIDIPPIAPRRLRRFYGTVDLDASRLNRDVGQIAEAIVQHLVALVGAEVRVTLEIHAEISDGAPDHTVRTVSENARTLSFDAFGFEEE